MVQAGRLVDRQGHDVYLPAINRLAIPITFLRGADNGCFLTRGSELSFELLRVSNPGVPYARHVIPDYGHIDCIFGKNAAADVYPHVLAHFGWQCERLRRRRGLSGLPGGGEPLLG